MDVFMGKGKYVGPKNKKDTPKKVEAKSNKTVKEALIELNDLFNNGLIDKFEFEKMREDILKRV
jgi:hypothetical protein